MPEQPPGVHELLTDRIASLAQLDIVLMLFRTPMGLTAEEVFLWVQRPRAEVHAHLDELCRWEIAVADRSYRPVVYSIDESSPWLPAIASVACLPAEAPSSQGLIVSMIHRN